MKDYLSVREWNQDTNANIRFSFCARIIKKKKKKKCGNFVIRTGIQNLRQTQCQTLPLLPLTTKHAGFSPTPLKVLLTHTCVFIMTLSEVMRHRCWKSHLYPVREKGTLWGTSMHRQTYCKTEKWGREIKLKQQSFHAQVPTNYSLLTQHQNPQLHQATNFSLWGFRHRGLKHLAC